MAVVGNSKKQYYGFFFECRKYSDLDKLKLQNFLSDSTKCNYAVYIELIEPELHLEGMVEFVNRHTISAVRKMLKNVTVTVRTTDAREAATKFRHINGAWEHGKIPKGRGARSDIEAKVNESQQEIWRERALVMIKDKGLKLDTNKQCNDEFPALGSDPIATFERAIDEYLRLYNESTRLEEVNKDIDFAISALGVQVVFGVPKEIIERIRNASSKLSDCIDKQDEYMREALWHMQELSTALLGGVLVHVRAKTQNEQGRRR
jgi:hypothetical protein